MLPVSLDAGGRCWLLLRQPCCERGDGLSRKPEVDDSSSASKSAKKGCGVFEIFITSEGPALIQGWPETRANDELEGAYTSHMTLEKSGPVQILEFNLFQLEPYTL